MGESLSLKQIRKRAFRGMTNRQIVDWYRRLEHIAKQISVPEKPICADDNGVR